MKHPSTAAVGMPTPAAVADALRELEPLLAAHGWDVWLLAVRDHFVIMRLADASPEGMQPWVLRWLDGELHRRFPDQRGVILS